MKIRLIILAYTLFIIEMSAQNLIKNTDYEQMSAWADSVMATLSPEERLGQLIIPMFFPQQNDCRAAIKRDIDKYHIGGMLLSRGTISLQEELTKYGQSLSPKVPLMMASDSEWGLAMRLSDAVRFPKNGDLGKIDSTPYKDGRTLRDELLYEYGLEVGKECRAMGIHVNFAPVLDINSNPKNPVIGVRSFGDNVEDVTAAGLSYSAGLEAAGVMAVAKHFPGHGDTDTDSHKTLPLLSHSQDRMETFEMKPFQSFVEAGYGGIMAAHLEVPSLEPTQGMPSSASKNILDGYLREKFGFDGLIFTDGLAMQGCRKFPDFCVTSLLAGTDILLDPIPLDEKWNELLAAIKDGRLPQEVVDAKCRRVLMWKFALRCWELPDKSKIDTEYAQELAKKLEDAVAGKAVNLENPSNLEISSNLEKTTNFEKSNLLDNPNILENSNKETPLESKIDSIVADALKNFAFPGCQVLVMKDGKALYNKAFGYQDEHESRAVTKESIFDLASVSKAAATVPALMLAIDEFGISINDKLSKYIPELKGSDKQNLTIRQALYHETGMRDSYPFYAMTIDSASVDNMLYTFKKDATHTILYDKNVWFHKGLKWNPEWISQKPSAEYSLQIAEGMYIKPEFRKEILAKIIDLPLKGVGSYRYSCLNFVMLRLVIENVSGKSLDVYLEEKLFRPLGLSHTCYNPLQHEDIDSTLIVPTEDDHALRKQMLKGYVHDEIAAWSGGVEGNAGLFSNATELARILQLFLDNGRLNADLYGGEDPTVDFVSRQIFKPETVKLFTTSKTTRSRRGLGFDKPDAANPAKSPCAEETQASVFGHTGYTGTCFWVDPTNRLIYIFLSNRVCPSRLNTKLTQESYRTKIQSEIYKSLSPSK